MEFTLLDSGQDGDNNVVGFVEILNKFVTQGNVSITMVQFDGE